MKDGEDMIKVIDHFVTDDLMPFPKQPHPRAVFDGERRTWRLGELWYMPDKCSLSPWVWYDWDKDEVVGECLNPDARVEVKIE